jgi:hypothetical protein
MTQNGKILLIEGVMYFTWLGNTAMSTIIYAALFFYFKNRDHELIRTDEY